MNHITPAKRDLPDYFDCVNDSTDLEMIEDTGKDTCTPQDKKKMVTAIKTALKHGVKLKNITKEHLSTHYPDCAFLAQRLPKSVGQVLSNLKAKMGKFISSCVVFWPVVHLPS